jgi:3-dehydroquinate dehydratase II
MLVVHGPNLSQLGTRDPAVYGTATEADLVAGVAAELDALGAHAAVELYSDSTEGGIVDRLHRARSDGTAAVLVNPGALTHYSWALHDALELLECPVVEVHLSQTHAREPFRRHSVVSPVADVTITGAGALGYRLAVRAALARLTGT